MWEKACYSNYDLNLSKQTFFDERISAKQKGTKQMNIDRKLRSHVTAVTAVFMKSVDYLKLFDDHLTTHK